eukprot:s1470_g16.t1
MRTFCCAPILLALRIPFLPLACVHCAPLPESEAEVLDKPVQGDVASCIQVPNRASEARNFTALERYSDETNSLNSHTDLDVFCDDHWTSTGVSGFWKVSEKSDSLITWTIERGNKGGQVSSSWSRGTACEGGRIKKGTAVVVAQSTDRFSPNVWHQLAAMFMAWVTPQALEALDILPQNISVSYYVPDIGDKSVEKNSGAFDWQMLGPVTSKRCNFEHDILSPGDGFMWDLEGSDDEICKHLQGRGQNVPRKSDVEGPPACARRYRVCSDHARIGRAFKMTLQLDFDTRKLLVFEGSLARNLRFHIFYLNVLGVCYGLLST